MKPTSSRLLSHWLSRIGAFRSLTVEARYSCSQAFAEEGMVACLGHHWPDLADATPGELWVGIDRESSLFSDQASLRKECRLQAPKCTRCQHMDDNDRGNEKRKQALRLPWLDDQEEDELGKDHR